MGKMFSELTFEEKEAHYESLSRAAGVEMEKWEQESKVKRAESGMDATQFGRSSAMDEKVAMDRSGAGRGGGSSGWGGHDAYSWSR